MKRGVLDSLGSCERVITVICREGFRASCRAVVAPAMPLPIMSTSDESCILKFLLIDFLIAMFIKEKSLLET